MATQGIVYVNDEAAGILFRERGEYVFRYYDSYFNNSQKKAISVTLPKKQQEYRATKLFPFFFNMLSEGVNRALQCRQLQIDENDDFSLLLKTGNKETIGAVHVSAEQA